VRPLLEKTSHAGIAKAGALLAESCEGTLTAKVWKGSLIHVAAQHGHLSRMRMADASTSHMRVADANAPRTLLAEVKASHTLPPNK